MGMDREELREALHRELRASGRFSEVDEVRVEAGPERSGLVVGGHRVLITFAPSVRVADPSRFTTTVRVRFEEVFPSIRVEDTGYRDPEPADGVVDGEGLRIRPARGPTVVLTVLGLEGRLTESDPR